MRFERLNATFDKAIEISGACKEAAEPLRPLKGQVGELRNFLAKQGALLNFQHEQELKAAHGGATESEKKN